MSFGVTGEVILDDRRCRHSSIWVWNSWLVSLAIF